MLPMHDRLGHDARLAGTSPATGLSGMNNKVERRSVLVTLAVACATGFSGCVTTPPPAAPAPPREPTETDVTFESISQRYLEEMMALTPVSATSLGNHRFDGDLDDVSVR